MAAVPKLDDRAAAQLEQELRSLVVSGLRHEWPGISGVEETGPLGALIAIGARFAEIVIERLNRAPDKTLLAYLDLLGVSRLQAQPAYVPITFQLAPGASQDAFVPEGTQVAASVQSESEAVVFETERDLVITPVRLPAVYAWDRASGRYYEWRSEAEERPETLVLRGGRNVEHILYAGHSALLGLIGITSASIRIDLEQPAAEPLDVQWELYGPSGWQTLDPAADTTAGLTRSGEITLPVSTGFAETVVNGRRGRWVRMRSVQAIRPGDPVPRIRSLRFRVAAKREHLRPEMVFSDAAVLDATKDFFPFGTRPVFGAAFYLSSGEVFATPAATVTLHIALTNPATGESESPIPRVNAVRGARLQWETFDGTRWLAVGLSSTTSDGNEAFPGFKDETRALTQTGGVTIPLPSELRTAMVNGRPGNWLRVRLTGGDYGADRPFAKTEAERSDLAPPAIRSLEVEYELNIEAASESLLLYNDFDWTEADATGAFTPMFTGDDRTAALYFGFVPPAARGAQPFTSRTLALYFSLAAELIPGISKQNIAWEYWKDGSWQKWSVTDTTASFSRSGAVWILPPQDMAFRDEFGSTGLWFRALLPAGSFEPEPLRGVYLNTVGAWQSQTVRDEILGASNATPEQSFFTLNHPVLPGQKLEVWESGAPPRGEQEAIRRAEGQSAIREDNERAMGGVWVTWHATLDLYDSGPRDRHYVMHNSTGEVVFGDGTHGLIPPPGTSNIRMRLYRTGGGLRGNKPGPGEISQLKTTLPYVAKAFNPESPAGGADAESDTAVRLRGPRIVRHRDRAVTAEDFEDVAMMASPEVARTKAVPLRDLQSDPLGSRVLPGAITVIVVPKSLDAKPVPRPLLLSRVRDYLDQRRLPATTLAVVGPCYVRVDVQAVVAADAFNYPNVELEIIRRLQTFLHPLTGGPHGTGWKFGRRLRTSDLYKVIAPVPGVRYVSSLELHEQEEPPGVLESAHFLIYSGDKHRIEIVPPEM